jgi:hypothetical protein
VNSPNEQAVLVYLDGKGLPKEVYEKYDLATLEDQLIEAIESQSLGEFDGNEIGPDEAALFMYAPNAETLFKGIEPILLATRFAKTHGSLFDMVVQGRKHAKLLYPSLNFSISFERIICQPTPSTNRTFLTCLLFGAVSSISWLSARKARISTLMMGENCLTLPVASV